MADIKHDLRAISFVVDSPLSSKVAMFNNQVQQHKNSQLLNPFSQTDGRSSPKPNIGKDEYGKPLAGSLTEMRGQKASMHVMKEIIELCQIIDSEGYPVKDEPTMRVIPFGELFNIYNYISDKCVGLLLRARKHKLVEFEGEMLFQRRDDNVPVFLLKPVSEIRRELDEKIDCIKRAGSPAPQSTSVLLDKKAQGLNVPRGGRSNSATPSPNPSPASSKASSPVKELPPKVEAPAVAEAQPQQPAQNRPKIQISDGEAPAVVNSSATAEVAPTPAAEQVAKSEESTLPSQHLEVQQDLPDTPAPKSDLNNNDELPTITVEASAVFVKAANENTTSTTDTQSEQPTSPAATASPAV